jgi:hypothetical protein
MDEDKKPQVASQEAYFDTAIRAVRQKKPPPEIDFTLHTMEDGSQVSTQERVCKGTLLSQRASRSVESDFFFTKYIN